MTNQTIEALTITTIHNQLPPWYGFNAKIPQIIKALRGKLQITVLTYGNSKDDLEKLCDYWGDVTFVPMLPKSRLRSIVTAALGARLRVSAMRNFRQEAALLREAAVRNPTMRLLVDDLAGVELLPAVRQGAVVSCNDCASDYAYHEFRLGVTPGRRLRSLARMLVFLRYEIGYLHLSSAVHVVKQQDGERLLRLNKRINPVEIPLASVSASRNQELGEGTQLHMPARILVWGNLELGLVASGFKLLIEAWREDNSSAIELTVLGRIPENSVHSLLGVDELSFAYFETVMEIDEFLRDFDIVILPDTAGSGQKFRLLDLMRNGKCVLGFPHPFEGMPVDRSQYYVACNSATAIWEKAIDLALADRCGEIGFNARRVFEQYFGFAKFADKWFALLSGVPNLEMSRS